MKTPLYRRCFTCLLWGFSFLYFFLLQERTQGQGIAINVDPYNSSPEVPLQGPLAGEKPSIPPLPKPESDLSRVDVYYVKEDKTQKPTAVGGNAISSHQSLPPVPPVKEPYSRPQLAREETFGSTSPFDITPEDIPSPIPPKTPPQGASSPSSIPIQIITPTEAQTSPISTPQPSRRRHLKDILVFSEPPDMATIARNLGITSGDKQDTKTTAPATPNAAATYRVLVRASSGEEEKTLKALYPDAFRTNHQGQTFWQIGRFSSKTNAQQAAKPIAQAGLKFLIVP